MAAKKKLNPTTVGFFVLGALLLMAVGVLTLGGAALFAPKQRAVVFFGGSVSGLSVGAPVNFRGVRVGSVDRIDLQFDATTLDARIPVFITLLPKQVRLMGKAQKAREIPFEGLIEKGMRASLNIESIVTGQLSVDLDFHPGARAVLIGSPDPEIPEIPTIRSDFDVLKAQLTQLPLGQMVDDLSQALVAVRELAQTGNVVLGKASGELSESLKSARRALDIASSSLAEMQTAATSVRSTSDKFGRTLDEAGPRLDKTLAAADLAIARADQALVEASHTLAHTAEMTAPGGALRADLEQTLRDLAETSAALRDFADTVKRRPDALLFGKE